MIQRSAVTEAQLQRWQWWHYAALAALVLLALAPCDLSVARLCYSAPLPKAVTEPLEVLAEVVGSGLGVFLILIAVVVYDRRQLARFPLLLAVSLGAGLLADVGKLCVSRARPHSLDLDGATFLSTFHGWFPMFSLGSKFQSFPSGHAATSMGFAIALSVIYPRGRVYFFLLAAAVAASRVIQHAHYPTDIAAGAMLGGAWAYVCVRGFASPAFSWAEGLIEGRTPRHEAGANVPATRPIGRDAA